jgi:hypothetical protein
LEAVVQECSVGSISTGVSLWALALALLYCLTLGGVGSGQLRYLSGRVDGVLVARPIPVVERVEYTVGDCLHNVSYPSLTLRVNEAELSVLIGERRVVRNRSGKSRSLHRNLLRVGGY